MIATEFAGPDWEDALHAYTETYREEHWYCETEEGLRGFTEAYAEKGETIQAMRLVSIGPWCVDWWEHFERGYRLEMKIGAPGST